MPRAQKPKRRTTLQNTQLGEARNRVGEAPPKSHGSEKENPPKKKQSLKDQVCCAASKLMLDLKRKLENTQRKVRHLQKRNGVLKEKNSEGLGKEKEMKKRLEFTETEKTTIVLRNIGLQDAFTRSEKMCHILAGQLSQERRRHWNELEKYKKRLRQANKARELALKRALQAVASESAAGNPIGFKLTQKRTYTATARKMMRMLVQSGCAQSKVGRVLNGLAEEMGAKDQKNEGKVHVVSWHTVSRAVLEGYIAAKQQLGYEMSQAPGMYIFARKDCHLRTKF